MKYPDSLSRQCPSIENCSLRDKTYVKIGGPTPLLLEPRNRDELLEVVGTLRKEGLAFRMLGGGSNLLVNDEGIPDVVVSTRRLSLLYKVEENELCLGVEAGVSTARFVTTCQKFGLKGAECLIGIPGTVGGAAVMNAGGKHGSIGSLITDAVILNASGETEHRQLSPKDFGYRESPLLGEVVLEVFVTMERGNKDTIWDTMSEILLEKKRNQPLMKKTCGCVFKNPAGESAGRLLDKAGMKGRSSGEAVVSDHHANFIINQGNCTYEDYHSLIRLGREEVSRKHGIDLELEIEVW